MEAILMNTAILRLNKHELNNILISIQDSLNCYRFKLCSAITKEQQILYKQKTNEYLNIEEIVSNARKELVKKELNETQTIR